MVRLRLLECRALLGRWFVVPLALVLLGVTGCDFMGSKSSDPAAQPEEPSSQQEQMAGQEPTAARAPMAAQAPTAGSLTDLGSAQQSDAPHAYPAPPMPPAPAGQPVQPAAPAHLAFQARTLDGKTFSGTALAGNSAVLWFWTPWCTVCRAEAPEVAAVARQFMDKVAFIGVAGHGQEAEMAEFASTGQIDFIPHVVDADGRIWSGFGVVSQPAFAFIHPDGRMELVPGSMPEADLVAKVRTMTSA